MRVTISRMRLDASVRYAIELDTGALRLKATDKGLFARYLLRRIIFECTFAR